jgi:excisionase family DNA binding protein
MNNKEIAISTTELMKRLQIKKRDTLYKYIKNGMPCIRVGNKYLFIYSEVIEWFKNRG